MSAAVLKHLNISTNLVKYILSSGLLPPANKVWCKVKILVASVTLSGDVISCLAAWSHVPLGGFCLWSHVHSGSLYLWSHVPSGGFLSRGVSLTDPPRQRCPLDRGPPRTETPQTETPWDRHPLDRDPQTETSPGTVKSG